MGLYRWRNKAGAKIRARIAGSSPTRFHRQESPAPPHSFPSATMAQRIASRDAGSLPRHFWLAPRNRRSQSGQKASGRETERSSVHYPAASGIPGRAVPPPMDAVFRCCPAQGWSQVTGKERLHQWPPIANQVRAQWPASHWKHCLLKATFRVDGSQRPSHAAPVLAQSVPAHLLDGGNVWAKAIHDVKRRRYRYRKPAAESDGRTERLKSQ